MTPDPLLRPLEELLNRGIAASTRAQELLAGLAGHSLELRVRGTPLGLRFEAGRERLAVGRPGGDAPADAVLEGTPFALARLARPDVARPAGAGQLQISGDAEVAQGFRQLFAAGSPDFEEELARLTGDVAAHHLANFARDTLAFGRRAAGILARNAAEYLTEERRDLPTRAEAEEFLAAVDELREAVDRLEARLVRLERGGARP